MKRAWYSDKISKFIQASPESIIGAITSKSSFSIEETQRDAWVEEIKILKDVLSKTEGKIYFEGSVQSFSHIQLGVAPAPVAGS
jgi:hypothetical protein